MINRIKIALCGATMLAGISAGAQASPVAVSRAVGHVSVIGTINLAQLAAGGGGGIVPDAATAQRAAAPEARLRPYLQFPRAQSARVAGELDAAAALAHYAGLKPTAIVRAGSRAKITGFDGINHADQRLIADNGNQFSLEPPDQGLAVGNGYVLETVNNALMVFDKTGKPMLAAPVSMHRFMNQVSEINRAVSPVQFGPSLSDPRAYYDAASNRWFVVEWATLNDASGNPYNISVQFLAVSANGNPTGSWSILTFETTNANVANCPCLPDYQQLGIDANGIYISHNLFGIANRAYAGTSIYAIGKADLLAGKAPALLEFPVLKNDFTVHPTLVPAGGAYASEDNGTEYLLESVADLTSSGVADTVKLFAIGNTASLGTATPALTLQKKLVKTQTYGNAPNSGLPDVFQKDGSRPLGGPAGLNEAAPHLSAGDARIAGAPMYVNGQIWAAIGTALPSALVPGGYHNGAAWFDIAASGGASALAGVVTAQGIVAPPELTNLTYPVVAMNTAGKGVLGVTVAGPKMFPSTGVISLSATGTGPIKLSGMGALPDDGFTAYVAYGGTGTGRWGDYAASAVDAAGGLWTANEYIPDTTARPRSTLANWGTYITRSAP